MTSFRLEANGDTRNAGYRVLLDDVDISDSLCAVDAHIDSRVERDEITLTLHVGLGALADLRVDEVRAIGIDDDTARLLRDLGWTPPKAGVPDDQ